MDYLLEDVPGIRNACGLEANHEIFETTQSHAQCRPDYRLFWSSKIMGPEGMSSLHFGDIVSLPFENSEAETRMNVVHCVEFPVSFPAPRYGDGAARVVMLRFDVTLHMFDCMKFLAAFASNVVWEVLF
jgi:hypothetical protein